MSNADMPVNPVRAANNIPFSNHDYGAVMNSMIGLTKREQFAAMAMQGFCAIGSCRKFMDIARDSVKMADALFLELEE